MRKTGVAREDCASGSRIIPRTGATRVEDGVAPDEGQHCLDGSRNRVVPSLHGLSPRFVRRGRTLVGPTEGTRAASGTRRERRKSEPRQWLGVN